MDLTAKGHLTSLFMQVKINGILFVFSSTVIR